MTELEKVQKIIDKATELTAAGLLNWYKGDMGDQFSHYYCRIDGPGTLKIEIWFDPLDGSYAEITNVPVNSFVPVKVNKLSLHRLITQIKDVCFSRNQMLEDIFTRMNEKLVEATK